MWRSRLRLGGRPWAPGSRPLNEDHAAQVLIERLGDRPDGVFCALDPLALAIARHAASQRRDHGLGTALWYDRSKSPAMGSSDDARELSAIGDVAIGTAASEPLAADDRWPDALRGRVPAIYSTPSELADADAMEPRLKALVERGSGSRVGLFLPPRLTAPRLALLRHALKLMAPLCPVVFGHHEHPSVARYGVQLIVWRRVEPAPAEDELARLAARLAVIVCPSVWTGSSAPSAIAVGGAARGAGLVTSKSVANELPGATPVDAISAHALAAAVTDAMPSHESATRDRTWRSRFSHRRQVEALRAHGLAGDGRKLAIGPRNGNGQAWAWAQALRRRGALPVEVFTAEYPSGRLAMIHETDVSIPLDDWKRREWQIWWAHRLQAQFSHVLIEQGLTACGWLNGKGFFDDLPAMLDSGMKVGLVFRGSEIRDPAGHAAREHWSPFQDPDDPLTAELQSRFALARREVDRFDVPKFVTTMDLLDDVPGAVWLPQVLDTQAWRPGPPILQRARPVVLHAPSRTEQMKGSQWVDEACQPLHDAGVIEYRRLWGVPFAEMPERIRDADIVIDQLALGSYGVLALQAMASERLVIGHVSERVRSRLSDQIPVVEAEPPDVRRVLEDTLAARDHSRGLGASGREYVLRYHAGEESAARLQANLVGP